MTLMWASEDEREGLLTGETRWRVDRQANEVMVCRDWYDNGVLTSPQHVEYSTGNQRPLVWRNHHEGASGIPYVSVYDFAAALTNDEL